MTITASSAQDINPATLWCVYLLQYILLYSLYPGPLDNSEWYRRFFTNSRGIMAHLKSEKIRF